MGNDILNVNFDISARWFTRTRTYQCAHVQETETNAAHKHVHVFTF